MKRKIGEIFEYNGEWYQCINTGNCSECAFTGKRCYDFSTKVVNIIGDCSGRTFKKLEKFGEPYMDGGKIMQKYKRVYQEPIYFPYKELNCYNDLHGRICIEIKQTKEDMKTTISNDVTEHSNSENIGKNLKAFDLQAAKSGKPVCTRDGRKARIICFDSKNDPQRPIIALVENNSNELLYEYTIKGKDRFSHISTTGTSDLMMLPEKKEGWVNVSKFSTYASKEEALSHKTYDIIDTIKVSWEE